ncbi:MAG: ORF6N domain-containing protein [Chitinophagaceae bacterium]|jgi:ATP-dependent Lon protease|nr:MAG: ORF6N domain-containing protein [Chitinophagaceae bacterium]
MPSEEKIQDKIHEIRGERVMLDFDLAVLYDTTTKAFNQAVRRNKDRFPEDFLFQLSEQEWQTVQNGLAEPSRQLSPNWSQIVTSSQKHRKKALLPYAFTEQGVAMLSGVLHSPKAIKMNISIMRAFVEIRRFVAQNLSLKEQLKEIRERLGEHDVQLKQIYDTLENMLNKTISQQEWESRERIGYKK